MLLLTNSYFSQTAYAHAYSVGHTDLKIAKDKTILTYSIDALTIIEKIPSADANKDQLLSEDELKSNEPKIEELVEDAISLEVNQQEQPGEVSRIILDKKKDTTFVTLSFEYPGFHAGQTITFSDGIYQSGAPTGTNYVDFLIAEFDGQISQKALEGSNRTWTMLLTENQETQQQDTTISDESSGNSPNTQVNAGSTGNTNGGSSTHDAASGWYSFFKLGMTHILFGTDHLLFLFALLLRKQKFKEYALIITAFTLAHSITLSLAALDVVQLPSRLVESVIAFSICYVAIENIFRKQIKYRWSLTFFFGLIHGLGFASVLQEIELPKQNLAISLISFNLGIEALQLLILAAVVPLLTMLQKLKPYRTAINIASGLIFAMGTIWLCERLFL